MPAQRTVVIDLAAVTSPDQLQDLLAAGFSFPDYYGRNWNAFSDCVTTLDPMPARIVVRGMSTLEARFPREAEQLLDCLQQFRTAPDLSHVELTFE